MDNGWMLAFVVAPAMVVALAYAAVLWYERNQ